MPYKLRPESKLKRPFWYHSEDEDLENASTSDHSYAGPRESTTEESTVRINSAVAHLRLGESSLAAPHPLSHERSPPQPALQVETTEATSRLSLDMAKVKHVRLKRKADDGGRSLAEIGHAARTRLQSTQPPVELIALSIDPNSQPAAFPSLPTDQPTVGPVEHPNDHGLPRRMDAYKNCSQAGIERSERDVDAMYTCKRFPANMDAKQKEWYTELQKRWLPGEELVQVRRCM